jgi:short-subunit dehydrogenase
MSDNNEYCGWSELPRVAWVTGAGKGMGRALALRLAREGWTVHASARTKEDLEDLATEANSLRGDIVPKPLDITDAEACAETVNTINDDGPLGLVVLNAGTHIPTPAKDFQLDAVNTLIDVNLRGTTNCLAPVMEAMREQGYGKIGVVASVAGYKGLPSAAAYSATKAGTIALCESLHPELRAEGVWLSVINPGFVRTPLTDKNDFPMPFLMEVDDAVSAMIKGLERDTFEIAFPTRFVLILKFLRLLPDWLYFRITAGMVR